MSAKTLRCAVYTRKSTDEGLEKAFNSLDAQREACEAFIRAQAHEGWRLVPDAFDDGGYSGGSLDRPALQSLLSAIDAGRVEIVVVYKIDRLTRSLADFAKLVERFDARSVSFVSVTQAFNTTNSMGRLTLNVLLSFAQFEREVTAERIRDKIAASRAKGLWMGGGVPLGYSARDRQLHIDPASADTVRWIFDQYRARPSLGALAAKLNAQRCAEAAQPNQTSGTSPRSRWTAGALGYLLRNRTYLGEAVHKGRIHPGRHEAIVARSVFDDVQTLLDHSANRWKRQRTTGASGLLTGLVLDDQGHRMTPQWSLGSQGVRHGYYVSAAKLRGNTHLTAGSLPRIRADTLDAFALRVWRALSSLTQSPEPSEFGSLSPQALTSSIALSSADALSSSSPARARRHAAACEPSGSGAVAPACSSDAPGSCAPIAIDRDAFRRALTRIVVGQGRVETTWSSDALAIPADAPDPLTPAARLSLAPLGLDRAESRDGLLTLHFRIDLCMRGGRTAHHPFITPQMAGPQRLGQPDPRLVRALQWGHAIRRQIERGQIKHFEDWTGPDTATGRNSARDLFRLALLAPDLQRRIVLGDHPAWWSLTAIAALNLPPDWNNQRQRLGLGPAA
jgi:DNA invertase Pin-like site-specific DNA recombinase